MSQMSFSDFEYAGKRKQTRRERFLAEMEQVVPWSGLVALIEPHYPKAGVNRPWFSRHSPSSGNSVSHTLLETAA